MRKKLKIKGTNNTKMFSRVNSPQEGKSETSVLRSTRGVQGSTRGVQRSTKEVLGEYKGVQESRFFLPDSPACQ